MRGWGGEVVSQAGGQLCQAGPGVQESAQTRLGRGQRAESSRDARVDEILQPGAHRCWAAPSPNPHVDPTAPKNPSPAPQAGRAAHECTQLDQSPGQGLRAACWIWGFGGGTGAMVRASLGKPARTLPVCWAQARVRPRAQSRASFLRLTPMVCGGRSPQGGLLGGLCVCRSLL